MQSLRRLIPVVVGLATSLATCYAQAPVTFSSNTSLSGETPSTVYAIDVNNDGITDIVQDTAQIPNGFTVSIANGDGSFRAPVFYAVSYTDSFGGKPSPTPLASGDFNGDARSTLQSHWLERTASRCFSGKATGRSRQRSIPRSRSLRARLLYSTRSQRRITTAMESWTL